MILWRLWVEQVAVGGSLHWGSEGQWMEET